MNRVFLLHCGHLSMDIILPPPGHQAFCPTDLNVRALKEVIQGTSIQFKSVLLSKSFSPSLLPLATILIHCKVASHPCAGAQKPPHLHVGFSKLFVSSDQNHGNSWGKKDIPKCKISKEMSNSATRQPFEGTETFAERNPL